MKSLFKIFIAVIVISVILLCANAVFADSNASLISPYFYFLEDFSTEKISSELSGFEYVAENGCVKVKDNSSYHFISDLGGKTQIAFNFNIFSLQKISTVYLCDSNENKLFEITFKALDDSSFNVLCGDNVIATELFGENIKLIVNVKNNVFSLKIQDSIGITDAYESKTDESCLLNGVHFIMNGEVYLDDLNVQRENVFVKNVPLLYETDNILSAGIEVKNTFDTDKKYVLYLAQYTPDSLLHSISCVETVVEKGESTILELSQLKKDKTVTTKSYLFTDGLSPVTNAIDTVVDGNNLTYDFVTLTKSAVVNQEVSLTSDIDNKNNLPVTVKVMHNNSVVYENTFAYSDYIKGISFVPEDEGAYTVQTFLCNDNYVIKACEVEIVVCNDMETDTFVFCADKNYYLKNDEPKQFMLNGKVYVPMFVDNNIYLPVEFYKNNGIIISTDSENVTVTCGADSVTATDVDHVVSGEITLYNARDILKLMGYYHFDGVGCVLVISKNEKWSDKTITELTDYYSESVITENFDGTTVKNISAYDWGNKTHPTDCGVTTDCSASGNSSYYLTAAQKGFKGMYNTLYPEYDPDCMGYRIRFKAKASADYEGNQLCLYANFYRVDGLSNQRFYTVTPSKEEFVSYEVLIPKMYFITSEYSSIQFIFATKCVDGAENISGKIYFDNISIDKFLNLDDVKVNSAEDYKRGFENVIFSSSFEGDRNTAWSFYYWGKDTWPTYDVNTALASDGITSAYLDVPTSSFAGYHTKEDLHPDGSLNSYRVNADVYVSSDFKDATVYFSALVYKGSSVTLINGTSIDVNEKGIWIPCESRFTSMQLSGYDFDVIKFLFRVSATGSDPSGRVYFDNVRITNETYMSEKIFSDITADRFASWYTIGETVTFNFEQNALDDIERILGVIYNSDNDIVFEKTVSSAVACTEGWKWLPDKVGYYEAEFHGIRADGTQVPIVTYYDASYGAEVGEFELFRHSVAVVASASKPMEKRNKKLFLSDSGYDTDTLGLGNLIGFYGIRLHTVNWGGTVLRKGIEDVKDTYNWEETSDVQVQNVKDAGYGALTINVFSTPKWAVAEEHQSKTGNTIVGAYNYNCYAPENMDDLADFLTEITNRYKDDTLIWEFWNEPQTGKTAFWQDSTESFAEMMKTAYSAIKAVDPGAKVSIGGLGANNAYYTFYDSLLCDEDAYNSFDMLAIHGEWDDSEKFNNIAKQKGYDVKPFWNSEGYYHAYYESGVPADTDAQALYFVMNIMQHFKQGSEVITHFSSADLKPDEYRVFANNLKGTSHSMGLFRNYPHYEPKLGAVVAHNMFELIENDFEYVGEYVFAETQRAVRFNNGGNPILVIWNSTLSDFEIDSVLKKCLDGATITDMEGRIVTDEYLKGNKIYFITGLDSQKLDLLEQTDDAALNSDYEAPYYTCVLKNNYVSDVTAEMSNIQVFDSETFEVTDGITYISDGWNYKTNFDFERPDGFDASYSVYANTDGLYLLIDVNDNTHYNTNSAETVMSDVLMDSVEFSIDCMGDGNYADCTTFIAALTASGKALYKKSAADVGASIPEGCSPAGTLLDESYLNITRVENSTLYKIFIPAAELYPYTYPGIENIIRLSIVVYNNDGNNYVGYLEWGSGLANNEADAYKYGTVTFDCSLTAVDLDSGDGKLISGKANPDTNVAMMVLKNSEIVYADETESDQTGNFKFYVDLPFDGTYMVAVSGNGLSKNYYLTE